MPDLAFSKGSEYFTISYLPETEIAETTYKVGLVNLLTREITGVLLTSPEGYSFLDFCANACFPYPLIYDEDTSTFVTYATEKGPDPDAVVQSYMKVEYDITGKLLSQETITPEQYNEETNDSRSVCEDVSIKTAGSEDLATTSVCQY